MDWHRLFGLMLTDFFTGSPFIVELEKDLSLKQQFLDVVVLRKGQGSFSGKLPDGLEPLADHNLITFKSHRETLDDWTLKELTGHYVNYRKQVSPVAGDWLSEDAFRLLGVCARYPRILASELGLRPTAAGVYECRRGTDTIRVIVTGQVPQQEHNAIWHLFSADAAGVQYGAAHYQLRSSDGTSFLGNLFRGYRVEGWEMTYTLDDYRRDYVREHLDKLTPEERLNGIAPEERLKGIPPEERLKGIPPEEWLKGIPPEERLKGIPPEERLKGIPPEEWLKGLSLRDRLAGVVPEELLRSLSDEDLVRLLRR